MAMPGFVRIIRDTGAEALIRADAITHILHNTHVEKIGDEKVTVPILSLHLTGNIVIHTKTEETALLKAMGSAMAMATVPVIDA